MAPKDDKIDNLIIQQAKMEEQVIDMKNDIKVLLEKLILGNGQPSVLVRLEANEVQLAELKWLKRFAISGFCTGLFGVAVALFERFI